LNNNKTIQIKLNVNLNGFFLFGYIEGVSKIDLQYVKAHLGMRKRSKIFIFLRKVCYFSELTISKMCMLKTHLEWLFHLVHHTPQSVPSFPRREHSQLLLNLILYLLLILSNYCKELFFIIIDCQLPLLPF
jgi:hypothetical protein